MLRMGTRDVQSGDLVQRVNACSGVCALWRWWYAKECAQETQRQTRGKRRRHVRNGKETKRRVPAGKRRQRTRPAGKRVNASRQPPRVENAHQRANVHRTVWSVTERVVQRTQQRGWRAYTAEPHASTVSVKRGA